MKPFCSVETFRQECISLSSTQWRRGPGREGAFIRSYKVVAIFDDFNKAKPFIMASIALLLMAGSVLADPAEIIKQKALAIRDMNNQREGITPPANPGAAPDASAPAAAPAPPAGPSASQQTLINRLQIDLTAIKTGLPAKPEQAVALQNDMGTLAKGAVKPSKSALTKLGADLSAALTEKPVSNIEMAILAKNINIVLNCSILTPARAQTYVSDAQAALKNSGVSDQKVDAVGKDLHAIVVEILQSKPKLFQ
jgi:hypothetical protein